MAEIAVFYVAVFAVFYFTANIYPPIILNSETELVIQGVYAGVFKFPSGSPRAL